MGNVKTAIIYYSSTGANYQMAQWALESIEQLGGDVRLRKVEELAPASAIEKNPAWKKNAEATRDISVATLDDLDWADAIIFSAPTRYGNLPAQMKQFMDSTGPLWASGKLANKVVTAMSSALNQHGGQEATILAMYTTMYHWGAIVVAPGYTDPVTYKAGGNPYGTSTSVDENGNIKEDIEAAVKYQARRAVEVATWLKNGAKAETKEHAMADDAGK